MLTLALAFIDTHNIGPAFSWAWYVPVVIVDLTRLLNFNKHETVVVTKGETHG